MYIPFVGKSIQEKGETTILGAGNNPTNFIAVQDIVQVLKIIVGNETYYNKILNIGGPENISRNEVVNLYVNFLKITPRVNHVPIRVLKVLSKLISPFHPGTVRIMKLSAYNDVADVTMNASESIMEKGTIKTWHDIPFDYGYFDQSHFIRDFKLFAAKTPTEYYPENNPLHQLFDGY